MLEEAVIPRSFSLLLAYILSLIAAQPVLACSSCFVAKKENLVAFFVTGVLLSLLPFLLAGGVGLWLYRRAKAQRALEENRPEEHHQEFIPSSRNVET